MDDPKLPANPRAPLPYAARIASKSRKKINARRHGRKGIWHGLGMMGLIGWSVALPTVLGGTLGGWLDKRYPGGRPMTLAFMVVGLVVGCWIVWWWISREQRALHEGEEKDDG